MPARKAKSGRSASACAVIGAGVTVPDNMMMAIGAAVAPAPAEDNAEARELYESVMASGMAGLAQWGITSLAKVPFAQSKPLLDELLGCVKFSAVTVSKQRLLTKGRSKKLAPGRA